MVMDGNKNRIQACPLTNYLVNILVLGFGEFFHFLGNFEVILTNCIRGLKKCSKWGLILNFS